MILIVSRDHNLIHSKRWRCIQVRCCKEKYSKAGGRSGANAAVYRRQDGWSAVDTQWGEFHRTIPAHSDRTQLKKLTRLEWAEQITTRNEIGTKQARRRNTGCKLAASTVATTLYGQPHDANDCTADSFASFFSDKISKFVCLFPATPQCIISTLNFSSCWLFHLQTSPFSLLLLKMKSTGFYLTVITSSLILILSPFGFLKNVHMSLFLQSITNMVPYLVRASVLVTWLLELARKNRDNWQTIHVLKLQLHQLHTIVGATVEEISCADTIASCIVHVTLVRRQLSSGEVHAQ